MFKNYLLTALRNFRKNKVFTILNILSLSFGITCCFADFAILRHEYSFDDFHQKKDQIFRVVEHEATESGMTYTAILPNAMPAALDLERSNIEDVIRMTGPVHVKNKFFVKEKMEIFTEPRALFTEASFLEHLDFPLLAGGPANLLDEKGTVFLTEKLAKIYFGDEDPLGKEIRVDDHPLQIRGILQNPPTTTNVPFNMLISDQNLQDFYGTYIKGWNAYWQATAYVVLPKQAEIKEYEKEINEIYSRHISKEMKRDKTLFLQPLKDLHTNDRYSRAVNYVPPSKILMGSVFIIAMILIVSILNFINLATSQSITRSKEVGIRKTLGGQKSQLIFQFLFETMLQVIVAVFIGLTISQILLDRLNAAVRGMSFHIGYDYTIVFFAAGLIILVAFLAGLYPAFILSRFNPIKTLHNQNSLRKNSGSFPLRKILITSQFVLANLLIVSTFIARSQMKFIFSKELGFDPENVVVISFTEEMQDKIPVFMHEYEKLPFVKSATWAFTPPQSGNNWNTNYNIAGGETNDLLSTNMKFIDENYLDLYGIELLYGRNITNSYTTDSTATLLVNEELVKRLGLSAEEALKTRISFNSSYEGAIVGIVKDFHVSKLNKSIKPVVMMYDPKRMDQLHLKLTDEMNHLPELEATFRKLDDENLFEPFILAERIKQTYAFENIIYTVIMIFTVLAIMISVIGLYGLVSFMIARNQKTIGIRKIFGASTMKILIVISLEYIILLTISFSIATPISWIGMTNWLNTFYYHIEISWLHFVVSFVVILGIALLTVGYQSYKAAVSNPVDALRHE